MNSDNKLKTIMHIKGCFSACSINNPQNWMKIQIFVSKHLQGKNKTGFDK